jgi:cytidine deaminase
MPRKAPHARLPALLRAALKARSRAYAPYSGFPVGAAVLAGGRIYAACNVENSSYPLSVCAERNAVAVAVAAGAKKIDAVAVVGGTKRPAAPCGGCRQVLAEFAAPDTPLVYATADGQSVTTTVGALLPSAFGPGDVMAEAAESRGTMRGPAGISRSAARVRGTRSSGRRRSP